MRARFSTSGKKQGKNPKTGTVLLLGFEPFDGEKVNPSQKIAKALDGQRIAGCMIAGAVLPCVFGASITELKRLWRLHRPCLVVCVGQAGGRREVTPERVAINVDDARMADNAGKRPVDVPVVRGGPAAYWSTLPIKAIVVRLRAKGIPAGISQTAGTFVCNHVFYGLMRLLAGQRTHRRGPRRPVHGGFVHVPLLPEQAGESEPSLPLATMIEAVALTIAVSLRTCHDSRKPGGQVC